MTNFIKISALSDKDRTKIKGYFKDLFGDEFANAMVEDYKADAKKKKVEASKK